MEVNLNLSAVNGSLSQFQQVPSGTYDLTVASAEWKETAAKNGSYFALGLQIVSGDHQGKTFLQNVTIANPSEKAVEIGLRTIKQIMVQIGHVNPDMLGNLNELINGNSFRANVELESFVGKDGNVGKSSSLKNIVSKEVSLIDGKEETESTRPSVSAPVAPVAPKSSPVIAAPKAAPAPVATPTAAPKKAAWMK